MENSYPNFCAYGLAKRRPVNRLLLAAVACACIAGARPVLAEDSLPIPALAPNSPITIDADSSEFNYETRRLVFHGLRMDQGALGVEADLAETDELDFTNGVWVFTGNVLVETATATLTCDEAHLSFVDHKLVAAELTGEPARFEQHVEETGKTNSGAAKLIVYKLDAGSLQLSNEAHFNDGSNQVSGDLITYDMVAQRLTASSGASGPVKILIEPPSKEQEETESP
jgi:lipopolysaccharide transport protein LptA